MNTSTEKKDIQKQLATIYRRTLDWLKKQRGKGFLQSPSGKVVSVGVCSKVGGKKADDCGYWQIRSQDRCDGGMVRFVAIHTLRARFWITSCCNADIGLTRQLSCMHFFVTTVLWATSHLCIVKYIQLVQDKIKLVNSHLVSLHMAHVYIAVLFIQGKVHMMCFFFACTCWCACRFSAYYAWGSHLASCFHFRKKDRLLYYKVIYWCAFRC